MARRNPQSGFTLVELLIVIVVVGVLAAIAIPNFLRAQAKSKVSRTAADLRTFETAFLDFAADTGDFPPDSHLDAPHHLANGVGIEEYVPVEVWVRETPLGGHYNWEGPDRYPYAGIAFFEPSAPVEQMLSLDEVLDDGDLGTGSFRLTDNGRYTYLLDESSPPSP